MVAETGTSRHYICSKAAASELFRRPPGSSCWIFLATTRGEAEFSSINRLVDGKKTQSHRRNVEGTSKRLRCLTIVLVIIHSHWAAGQKKERERGKKKKARILQLKRYKVLNFTLELNTLQWQISKAICMVCSWKAKDPKFLCLTGSNFPPRTGGFCSSPHLLRGYKFAFFFVWHSEI